jgi:hypothetical protein
LSPKDAFYAVIENTQYPGFPSVDKFPYESYVKTT